MTRSIVSESADLLVVGGGFYGSVIAASMAERGFDVRLVEREGQLCSRASYRNQARIHNGYHYPRSFTTGWRSHANYGRFIRDFDGCVENDSLSLYAIARVGSLTTARQFRRFCSLIDSPLRAARSRYRALFAPRAIEDVFEVEEAVLNGDALRTILSERLIRSGVGVLLRTSVVKVAGAGGDRLAATLSDGMEVTARRLVNCTYMRTNGIDGLDTTGGLKHEISEVAIVRAPDELNGVGFTIMDGSFGSVLPFPALDAHSMTHVRYTPHAQWFETQEFRPDPATVFERAEPQSRFASMVRDLARFVPAIERSTHVTSLFEVKTLVSQHEVDDARPIVFARSTTVPGAASVLGSKLDNIYDILEELDDFLA